MRFITVLMATLSVLGFFNSVEPRWDDLDSLLEPLETHTYFAVPSPKPTSTRSLKASVTEKTVNTGLAMLEKNLKYSLVDGMPQFMSYV